MNMQSLLQARLFLRFIRRTTAIVSYITSRGNVLQAIGVTLFQLSAPVAAQAATGYTGISSGRLGSIVAGVVGLISVVIGRIALTRSAARIGSRRLWAIAALVVALIGMVLSGIHLARSSGGFGTGSGRAGAIVALVVGLIGMILGGMALVRLRRTASASSRERT